MFLLIIVWFYYMVVVLFLFLIGWFRMINIYENKRNVLKELVNG